MKVCSLLYKTGEQLRHAVHDAGIEPDQECLVRIYTSVCGKDEAVAIAREVQEALPAAKIIGGTGSGVIFRGIQYEAETLILVEQFDCTEVLVSTFCFSQRTAAQMAQEITSVMTGDIPVMHVLCGDHYPDVHAFVEEFKLRNQRTELAGGVVGDILSKEMGGYVFTADGAMTDGIVVAALRGRELHTFGGVNIAHDPISPVYRLTRCDGGRLLEIEGEPAVDWAGTQFGMDNLREYHDDWHLIAENDALVRFPMMLEGHGGASRFIKYDAQSNSLSLHFSRLEPGVRFRIGYTSPTKCIQECYSLCTKIMGKPIESLFCYSCLFRKMYLQNCAEWELRPFTGYEICGVFMMGEIGSVHHVNEFLNGSCSFVGVGERENGVQPDLSVFEDLYKIQDDNDALHNFVLKRFSVATSAQNQRLLEKLLSQEKSVERQMLIDANTGLNSSIMYTADCRKYHFDKLFMCKIENASLLLRQLGQERYRAVMIETAHKARTSPQCARYGDKLHFYALNESTLFMTADHQISQADFMQVCNAQYDDYQLVDLGDAVVINRFVVVLDQPNLLESALSTLETCQSLQTNFLVCDNNKVNEAKAEEIKILQVLCRVIEADGVVPYFQGIYDNKEKRITKYEALMRLRDTDGTLYAPAAFMEVSKRYHMYSILSKKMLAQVFDLFEGKETCVSINLSALDINLSDMHAWILQKLDKIGDAHNFIFEILEDEEFQDMDSLRAFVNKVREYGVGIAIDDFGSGYSNFMEIARIEPDYLKVDGSIVKNIQESDLNHKVLQNIVFLGSQLQAGLVAEYVENEMIQEEVESFGIDHSQGYLFSKPVPYEEIQWDSVGDR